MGRIIAGIVVLAAFCALTGTAFAHKGFYLGGGYATDTASGDIDGKQTVTNAAGTREGNIGKLDTGSGINLDAGWNFTNNLGFEFFTTLTGHTAKHTQESKDSNAGVANTMLGFKAAGHISESIEFFARLGSATSAISYDKYGHLGSTAAGVFTSVANKSLLLSGTGAAYGVGFEYYAGKHLGIALGYTVFAIKYNKYSVDSEGDKGLPKKLAETQGTGDLTVSWHF